jgi:hypothetical protein
MTGTSTAPQPHRPTRSSPCCRCPATRRTGRHDIPITPGLAPVRGLREDIIRYYARYLAQHGDTIKSLRRLAED